MIRYKIWYFLWLIITKIKRNKKNYLLYLFAFYIGLLLPVFCVGNIRSVGEVFRFTTFPHMEDTIQIQWSGENFENVNLAGDKDFIEANKEEEVAEWNHVYVSIIGTNEKNQYPLPHVKGREITTEEYQKGEYVCLVDETNAKIGGCQIGDEIKIHEKSFRIVGIIENKKYSIIYIPYRAMRNIYQGDSDVDFTAILFTKDKEQTQMDATSQIKESDPNAYIFDISDGEDLYQSSMQSIASWWAVRGAFAMISLLFFLLNCSIVLVGKLERECKSTGIKLAAGATRKDQLLCNLLETFGVTIIADILVLTTFWPLATIAQVQSMLIMDNIGIAIFVIMSVVMCEIMTVVVACKVWNQEISLMLRKRN